MKKLLFILLLSPLATYASNWILASEGLTSGNRFFVDTQSITRSGNSFTFWQLTNYAARSPSGILSTKTQRTANCRTREIIYRYYMFYDDLNATGKLITSTPANTTDKWEPAAPDTVDEFILKTVCNFK